MWNHQDMCPSSSTHGTRIYKLLWKCEVVKQKVCSSLCQTTTFCVTSTAVGGRPVTEARQWILQFIWSLVLVEVGQRQSREAIYLSPICQNWQNITVVLYEIRFFRKNIGEIQCVPPITRASLTTRNANYTWCGRRLLLGSKTVSCVLESHNDASLMKHKTNVKRTSQNS